MPLEDEVNEPSAKLVQDISDLLPRFHEFYETFGERKIEDANSFIIAFQELIEQAYPLKQSADEYTRRFDHG